MKSMLPSKLNEKQLTAIQILEDSIGKPLYAYSVKDISVADLSKDDLTKVLELEKKLGLHLLAIS